MTNEELESNFASILRDTVPRRVSGKEPKDFIISCVLQIKHEGRGREHFKVDLTPYFEEFRGQKSGKKRPEDLETDSNESLAIAAAGAN